MNSKQRRKARRASLMLRLGGMRVVEDGAWRSAVHITGTVTL